MKVDYKLRDRAFHERVKQLMDRGLTDSSAAEHADYDLKRGKLDKLMKQLNRKR